MNMIGRYPVVGVPAGLEVGGLSGGGFGRIDLARDEQGVKVVIKRCRAQGGSATSTVAAELHHPAVAYGGTVESGPARHTTLGVDDVATILEYEARMLSWDDGELLPALVEFFFEHPSPGPALPVVAMEHLVGRRAETREDVARVLESLARASEAGFLDYHGDLKPEHIFIDEASGRVRLIDPAPRTRPGIRTFTPEYNPYGLTGPPADVFAAAVILYVLIAHVQPFVFSSRPNAPFPSTADGSAASAQLDLPTPVARGRTRPYQIAESDWERMTTFVDEIVGARPDRFPPWAATHRQAFERLVGRSSIANDWTTDKDGLEWRRLSSGVFVTRSADADGTWRIGLETAAGDLPVVRVEGSAAWITWGPLNPASEYEDGADTVYTLDAVGDAAAIDEIVAVLDRLPYYSDLAAVGRLGSVTYWCGHRSGIDIVLTDTGGDGDPRGNGAVVPLDSLNRRRGRALRLEAEFGTAGVWDASPDGFDEIDVDFLPVSPELLARVDAWTWRLEALRDESCAPSLWGFATLADAEAFAADGAELAAALQDQLGPSWRVDYAPISPTAWCRRD